MGNLVVESSRHESREPRSVSVVHRRFDLLNGPFTAQFGRQIFFATNVFTNGRNVTHLANEEVLLLFVSMEILSSETNLEVEGKIPAGHQFSNRKCGPKHSQRNIQIVNRNDDAVGEPETF